MAITATYNVRAHFPIGQGTHHQIRTLAESWAARNGITSDSKATHPGEFNIETCSLLSTIPSIIIRSNSSCCYERGVLPFDGEKVAYTDHWGASSTVWSPVLSEVGKAGEVQCCDLGRLCKLAASACRRQRLLRGPGPHFRGSSSLKIF